MRSRTSKKKEAIQRGTIGNGSFLNSSYTGHKSKCSIVSNEIILKGVHVFVNDKNEKCQTLCCKHSSIFCLEKGRTNHQCVMIDGVCRQNISGNTRLMSNECTC